MDIKQLHYFVTIADEGNITAAARKLFMSQPPLSSQIKLLENELGCTLFERGPRSIHLTEAGQTLYQYANSILNLNQVAKQETMIAAKKHSETIRIGIVSSVICSSAPEWICAFAKLYPEIHFEIIEGNTYDLIQKFETAQIHLAILRTPFNRDRLSYDKIYTDRMVAIGNSDYFNEIETAQPVARHDKAMRYEKADTYDKADAHDMADAHYMIDRYDRSGRLHTSLSELSRLPLILYRRWESIIRHQFQEKQLDLNCSCINDDARTTLYFVESGMGVGLIPESALSAIHNKEIVCRSIEDCEITSDVVIAYNAANYLPECSKEFIEFVKKNYTR